MRNHEIQITKAFVIVGLVRSNDVLMQRIRLLSSRDCFDGC